MNTNLKKVHRRGSGVNPKGRFDDLHYEPFHDDIISEETQKLYTEIFSEKAKTIINSIDSPDVPFHHSINPYRGCEHGCIYCYARPSHAYVNLSPGLDFETKIFAKTNAAEVLKKTFQKKNYVCEPVVIGSNTDPYQPTERKLEITRSILEVFLKYKHPLSIITKSSLISRDIDILSELAKNQLVKVLVSITSLDKKLISLMEPRTASPSQKLETIYKLSLAGVPVGVMNAPIIPFINDHEMETILQVAKDAGAKIAGYTLIRLPYEVKDIFKDWLSTHFPLKAKHVIGLIKTTREGKENNSRYGQRFTGTGSYAVLLSKRFALATKKLELNQRLPPLRTDLFQNNLEPSLFLPTFYRTAFIT
jgi:DNA repair photolyase